MSHSILIVSGDMRDGALEKIAGIRPSVLLQFNLSIISLYAEVRNKKFVVNFPFNFQIIQFESDVMMPTQYSYEY